MKKIEVTVVVPILNEEKYIKNFLDSLLNQDYPKETLEIILVDGCSTDSTPGIIELYADKYDFIRLIENKKRTVQYALNLGIQNATGEIIVRMDAHAFYAKDYISQCVWHLKNTDASNVGGPTVVKGKSKRQKIIAAAYGSPFALGGANHYKKSFEGYSDTVSWGCFRKDYLISIGMYDERLPRSEDDDLNYRIQKNGGKIYITPKVRSEYYPRDTFSKLFKQYFEYGVWKIAFIKKHNRPPRINQLIPMAFVLFLICFGILSLFSKICCGLYLLGVLLYLCLDLYFSFTNKSTKTLSEKEC